MVRILAPDIIRFRVLFEFFSPQEVLDKLDLGEFVIDLTAVLGLTPLAECQIVDGTVHAGKSASLIYEESGCFVHTYLPEGLVTVYIDSCKKFRISDVKPIIRHYFRCWEIRYTVIKPLK